MKYEDELQDDLQDFQDVDDVGDFDVSEIVVYSRDWTIGTFYDQIEQGNIELGDGGTGTCPTAKSRDEGTGTCPTAKPT